MAIRHEVTVLSLRQPWASLIAAGAKLVETRGKKFNYTGVLYIHASKEFINENKALCLKAPFNKYVPDPEKLPLGKIVCRCDAVACYSSEEWTDNDMKLLKEKFGGKAMEMFSFGDFSAGRYGVELEDVVAFETPIPARGYPWPFQVDITDHLNDLK